MTDTDLDNLAVENFRRYLRIPSVHPDVNYEPCVEFLKEQAAELNLHVRVLELVKKKPIVLMTWTGTDPDAPTILLNSHMDVVPVYPELWSHDPFAAEMDSDGNIHARGAQDMKGIAIQYLEAIRRLQKAGQRLKRTVHLSFVPDEEIGGKDGMASLVLTQEFRDLNIGFGLDEGAPSTEDSFLVHHADRAMFDVEFKITGTEGHGSLLLPDTAGEKLRRLVDQIMDFRQTAVDHLAGNPQLTVCDVTSTNLTMLMGGVESNVIPPELTVTVDFRLAVDLDHKEFEDQLSAWMAAAGDGITLRYLVKDPQCEPTRLDDTNPYWVSMQDSFNQLGVTVKKTVCPGATDARYCRAVGVPMVGFSSVFNTPILVHANNEYVNKDIFLRGIPIYQTIISGLGNL